MHDDDRTGAARSRRTVLRGMAGAAVASVAFGASGTAAAQSERPDVRGWLQGVEGGFTDARGQDEVTVAVGAEGNNGNFAFDPAGVWIDSGTTVIWEWTGEGGGHNVNAQEGADFRTEIFAESGVHFERTFESGGIVTYQCDPHVSLGMKGAIAVGDDVPLAGPGDGGEANGGTQLPGGDVGAVIMAIMLGTAGVAVAAAFAGEFLAAVRLRTDEGPTSAYTVGAAVFVIALLLLLLIVGRLLVAG